MGEKIFKLSDFLKSKIIVGVTEIMFQTVASGEFYLLELTRKHVYKFKPAPDVYYRNLPIREVYSEPYRTFIYLKDATTLRVSWSGEGDKLVIEPHS